MDIFDNKICAMYPLGGCQMNGNNYKLHDSTKFPWFRLCCEHVKVVKGKYFLHYMQVVFKHWMPLGIDEI